MPSQSDEMVLIDGAGDRYRVLNLNHLAVFTLQSIERGSLVRVSSVQLGDLGMEWNGEMIKPVWSHHRGSQT